MGEVGAEYLAVEEIYIIFRVVTTSRGYWGGVDHGEKWTILIWTIS